ncbi:MAG: hypothetical protein HZC22_04180 [Rhodocyclales bacterium]|nr:hypothetical protein [Rhodocyclales bacterium]
MSKSAFSVRVFSIYMIVFGSGLIVAPNLILSIFAVAETHEVWIRIVGLLMLIVGYLDFMASRSELLLFFRWTVAARLAVPVFLIAFVVLGFAPPVLILFGAIDAAGAMWTAVCLREDLVVQLER